MGMQSLAETLRTRREELGLSQSALCRVLDWPESRKTYISSLENGVYIDVSVSRAVELAKALQLPVEKLLVAITSDLEQIPTPEALA